MKRSREVNSETFSIVYPIAGDYIASKTRVDRIETAIY